MKYRILKNKVVAWYRLHHEQIDRHGHAFIGCCQFISALLAVGIAAEVMVNTFQ